MNNENDSLGTVSAEEYLKKRQEQAMKNTELLPHQVQALEEMSSTVRPSDPEEEIAFQLMDEYKGLDRVQRMQTVADSIGATLIVADPLPRKPLPETRGPALRRLIMAGAAAGIPAGELLDSMLSRHYKPAKRATTLQDQERMALAEAKRERRAAKRRGK